jgi:hypothetical protein
VDGHAIDRPRGTGLDSVASTGADNSASSHPPSSGLGVCTATSTQPADRSARLTYPSSRRRSPRRRSSSFQGLSRRRSAQRRSVITLTVGSAAKWARKR